MDYRIFSMPSGEDENSTEAHVLARAYRAVWRATHGFDPTGQHQIAALRLVMDFGNKAQARVGTSHAGATLTARRSATSTACPSATPSALGVEPEPAPADVQPEGDMTTDLWTRVRRLIGNRIPSGELAKVLAGLRAMERADNAGTAQERELPHPVNRNVMANPERDPNDVNLQQKVRHSTNDRTRAQ